MYALFERDVVLMLETSKLLQPRIEGPVSATKEEGLAGNRRAREDKICGLGGRTERNRDCRKARASQRPGVTLQAYRYRYSYSHAAVARSRVNRREYKYD